MADATPSRPKFALPHLQHNPTGWGPCEAPEQFKDTPYQPFSKYDRLGKVADWSGNVYQDRRAANKYRNLYGFGGQAYVYHHITDTGCTPKPMKSRPKSSQQKIKRDREKRDERRMGGRQPIAKKGREWDHQRQQQQQQNQFGYSYERGPAHSLKEGKEDEEEEDEVMEKKEGIEKKLDNHASFCLEILNDDSGHYTEVDLASGKVTSHQLEPVGVFWDIENCQVPPDKSAFALANKIRKRFFEGKREAEFMCVCDINKERKEVMDDLNKAQVTVVHVSAVAKNSADDKLRQKLHHFAHTYHPPCTVVLISGDVNFAAELKDLRHAHNITITLVHNIQTSDALKVFANNLVLFDDLLQDLEQPTMQPNPVAPRVTVLNLPVMAGKGDCQRVANRLGELCNSYCGKVQGVNAKMRKAHIRFTSFEMAQKAQEKMTGEDVFGSKICVVVQGNSRQRTGKTTQRTDIASFQFQSQYEAPSATKEHRPSQGNMVGAKGGGPPILLGGPPLRIERPPVRRGGPPVPIGGPPVLIGGPPVLIGGPPVRRGGPPVQIGGPPVRRGGPPVLIGGPPFRIGGPPVQIGGQPALIQPQQCQLATPNSCNQPVMKLLISVQADPDLRRDVNVLHNLLHKVFLQARVKADHLAFLWSNYFELNVLLKLDIQQSAINRDDVVRKICQQTGDLSQSLTQLLGHICCKAVQEVCQMDHLPWLAELCDWDEDKEMADRRIRSNVIEVLLRQRWGYLNWKPFKATYSVQFGSSISELMIQTCCKNTVHLLVDDFSNQIICLYEFSPVLRMAPDQRGIQSFKSNLIVLLNNLPHKKISLMKLVGTYIHTYSPVPMSGRAGPLMLDIIRDTPNVVIRGKTLLSSSVALLK